MAMMTKWEGLHRGVWEWVSINCDISNALTIENGEAWGGSSATGEGGIRVLNT